ncbi:hypothetical protein V6N13_041337 [Hibiscus sabdariffa]|uniref:Uncharacterized protein n=1 Tax=Hibiscus sabdariffa TaxID=183260 RepID=A0ABR2RB09_9ROSI
MFRPAHAYSAQQLESLAATIAQCIGLILPPVNFYGIASTYLKKLSIPVEKILPHSCCIYEWVMPPELRLSANNSRLPSVCKEERCRRHNLCCSCRLLYPTLCLCHGCRGRHGDYAIRLVGKKNRSRLTSNSS